MHYTVKRDQKVLGVFKTHDDGFEWLQDHQSSSVHHALTYEGYSIEEESSYLEGLKRITVKGNMGDWQGRHFRAIQFPRGPEVPIVEMLKGWLEYADIHLDRYESGIGQDYVLGVHWAAIGAAIRGLLNGETGRLDCGTIDSLVYTTLKNEGFDPDNM